jgi:DnaJ family protein A protein 2
MPASLYERLEVSKDASAEDIKKAYMKMARKHHPDKGGDAEVFKRVQEAYEVLSDDMRRHIYDQTGSVDGGEQQQHRGGGGFPFPDIFASMFGGGGAPGGSPMRQHRSDKGPSSQANVGLSLENFYNGFELNMNFKRKVKCVACKDASSKCGNCNGGGVRTVMQQMGPMVFQSQAPCDPCRGTGVRNTSSCSNCKSERYCETDNSVTAKVVPGMREGEHITFEGQCSESPEHDTPGDLVISLRLASSRYEWKDDNLYLMHTITFKESILGFVVTLDDHPSRKQQVLRWSGGPLIHGTVLSMDGKGMPKKGGSGFGDLKIKLNVLEPPRVPWTPEQRAALESVLN